MKFSVGKQKEKCVCLTVFVCILSFFSGAVAAESLSSTAQKFYYGIGAPKNIQKAFTLYLKAAQRGDVNAMFIVGGLYMQGQGTSVNQAEAFKWLYKAALNGRSSKESQRILAHFFISGKNVPQNYSEALHWYEAAAENGDPEAQSELAFLYFSGKVVDRDYDKAFYWFDIAARNGYTLAQYNMGILWYTGNGVSGVDMVKAYAWFNLAAANGHSNGASAKSFLESILSEEELLTAQDLSTKLYREIERVQKQPQK
ncbi:MAG TPA: sel1 repeat family protein [Desulfobacterales bacterium]|nr:sel1 repeat family protein [Desulfobacterales bacterium]HIP40266.1 sel1 repeat family protein [Desulfocapsa sulfexigens]